MRDSIEDRTKKCPLLLGRMFVKHKKRGGLGINKACKISEQIVHDEAEMEDD